MSKSELVYIEVDGRTVGTKKVDISKNVNAAWDLAELLDQVMNLDVQSLASVKRIVDTSMNPISLEIDQKVLLGLHGKEPYWVTEIDNDRNSVLIRTTEDRQSKYYDDLWVQQEDVRPFSKTN